MVFDNKNDGAQHNHSALARHSCGATIGAESSLQDRLEYSPSVGGGRLLLPSVQAAALPVRAPIFPTRALAPELFGGTPRGPPQSGQMRFKIEETAYSVSGAFRAVTGCIAPPDVIVLESLFAICTADAGIWSFALRGNRSPSFDTCQLRSTAVPHLSSRPTYGSIRES